METTVNTNNNGESLRRKGSNGKTVVCVYLDGAMDTNDVLIPKDPVIFNRYQQHRAHLALAASGGQLTDPDYDMPMAFTDSDPAPGAGSLVDLFNDGRLKVIANIGNLVRPPVANSDGSLSVSHPPAGLYAHNVQTEQWMSARYDRNTLVDGWGGRTLRELSLPPSVVPRGFSFGGRSDLLVGDPQMELLASGAVAPVHMAPGATFADLMNDLVSATDPTDDNVFVRDYAEQFSKTISQPAALQNAIPPNLTFPGMDADPYPYLGKQFEMVVKAILAGRHATLNHQRQVIFVPWRGGWDMHSNQVGIEGRMQYLSRALGYFQKLLEDNQLADDVITFTATDFNRTFTPNQHGGTDHAWGGQTLVMGSAKTLAGGPGIIGTMHDFDVGGDFDVDSVNSRGRWIPTTAVVQLAATLAYWLGVPTWRLPALFPSLVHFPNDVLPLFSQVLPPVISA